MTDKTDTTDSTIARTLLGYEPIVDRTRKAIAMRVTARSANGGSVPLDTLYADLGELYPPGAIPLLLCTDNLSLPAGLLERKANRQIWVEVPPEQTGSQEGLQLVAQMSRMGFVQVLGGRPASVIPRPLLSAFKMSIIDVAVDRRLTTPDAHDARQFSRTISYAQSGVTSIAQLKRSFDAGALACIGWPFDDAILHASPSDSNADFGTITQLLSLIERDADAADIEKVIRRDAALAYRLLRYINSAAFGLTVEIQSFRHAVMMLGYERMKRWLLLMLATASKDANMQPVMFASFRRGLFMENLVGTQAEGHLRDEVFILGVLSLLDKLFREPLPQLLEKLYVPEPIRDALIDGVGPHAAYLRVAQSVEHSPSTALSRLLDDAFVTVEQCNRSLVKAVSVRDVAAAV